MKKATKRKKSTLPPQSPARMAANARTARIQRSKKSPEKFELTAVQIGKVARAAIDALETPTDTVSDNVEAIVNHLLAGGTHTAPNAPRSEQIESQLMAAIAGALRPFLV